MADQSTFHPTPRRLNAREAEQEAARVAAPLDFTTPQIFVTVVVDRDEKEQSFVVPKQLICHYSPFFAAAFNCPMVEGATQTMTMEDVEGRIFGYFVHWLYQQATCPGDYYLTLVESAKLYTLADRFMIPHLAGELLESIESNYKLNQTCTLDELREYQHYAYSPQGCRVLRRSAVYKSVDGMKRENLKAMMAGFPEEMLPAFARCACWFYMDLYDHSDELTFDDFEDDHSD